MCTRAHEKKIVWKRLAGQHPHSQLLCLVDWSTQPQQLSLPKLPCSQSGKHHPAPDSRPPSDWRSTKPVATGSDLTTCYPTLKCILTSFKFIEKGWKNVIIFKECFSCGNLVPQSQTRIWLRTTCGNLELSIARFYISCSFIFCLWCVLLIKINRTNGLQWPSSSRAARWAPDKHWWWSCRSSLRNSSGSQLYPWWSVGSYIASRKGT